MYTRARKYNMKMQYLEMCPLFLRDFTGADCSGHEQPYISWRCHEALFLRGGEFTTLSFSQLIISHCAPLFLSFLHHCTSDFCSTVQ